VKRPCSTGTARSTMTMRLTMRLTTRRKSKGTGREYQD
jgi:hypothetical protein